MDDKTKNLLRELPSVSNLLELPQIESLSLEFGKGATKLTLQKYLDATRAQIISQKLSGIPSEADTSAALKVSLQRLARPEGRRAINATGIMLHTGLGRAPLCKDATSALGGMGEYSILQTDIATGSRSLREAQIEELLIELTGAEAVTVVNNNAAATMLVLNTLAEGKEVVLSRGQLVEIGGAFRMPDVMAKSRCILREIGTTNRTHLKDYEATITEDTGALMHVHTSNYRVRGFSGSPDIKQLAPLAKKHGLPLIDDIGSGALVELSKYGLANEPLIAESIQAGSSVVTFSGDKLICGPQSGIICGKREVIERIRKNPFARMFRLSKLELAALTATLLHFVNNTFEAALPFYQMLTTTPDELNRRSDIITTQLKDIPNLKCEVVDSKSFVGSGSAPDEGINSRAVKISSSRIKPDKLAAALRASMPSVFTRINDDSIMLDMRTLMNSQAEVIANALKNILAS